ncbi:MAG: hypothetical protein ACJAZ8_000956 [Planctomycetota bacterium]|jgi:hypothetical protein
MLQAAASQAEQIQVAAEAERTEEPSFAGIGQGPDVVGAEVAANQDDWGDAPEAVTTSNANMPSNNPAIGWDGEPVVENVAALHELESDNSTRGNLVEWYAKAIADKEALQGSLMYERDKVDALTRELETALAVAAVDAQEISGLKIEIARQKTERQDLEARLVTAQIRRLESEKLLLQDRLEKSDASASGNRPSRVGTPLSMGPGQ